MEDWVNLPAVGLELAIFRTRAMGLIYITLISEYGCTHHVQFAENTPLQEKMRSVVIKKLL